ncbi:iron complex transport system ATP-binding protein [Izhakiella capsodis]|uniref:Iron complex transport system ATP-binding protein n=1 Tax=Izhakiella capsodis TaxID=1367852 RepID=A0A1I4W147_9GAMM|nr:ABC transporter ATP-binding protein [Izhakiella capsodis]SFN07284.1 iron complex transport system ATP-binding protein [Izhakiella capsodis]
MKISVNNLSVMLQRRQILQDICFESAAGQTTGLLGPNGSGKSTLLRCLAGLPPTGGRGVMLDDSALFTMSQRTRARKLAFVAQHADTEDSLRVEEIVRLGRTPHRSAFSRWRADDRAAVDRAIEQMHLQALVDRCWHQLSGGERQRCQIARALAQNPSILLLDEPTNHLDIQHQLELMLLISELPVTVVIALHDLNLAANYCQQLVVLNAGKIAACGAPENVLTPALIQSTWNINATVSDPLASNMYIQFSYRQRRPLPDRPVSTG